MINFNNYMISTEAIFNGCKTPLREPDYISSSGSKYWQQENSKGKYVIRLSNHWVKVKMKSNNYISVYCNRIASCLWHLKTDTLLKRTFAGKCYLKDFRPI